MEAFSFSADLDPNLHRQAVSVEKLMGDYSLSLDQLNEAAANETDGFVFRDYYFRVRGGRRSLRLWAQKQVRDFLGGARAPPRATLRSVLPGQGDPGRRGAERRRDLSAVASPRRDGERDQRGRDRGLEGQLSGRRRGDSARGESGRR
jgi:hypothetical protein